MADRRPRACENSGYSSDRDRHETGGRTARASPVTCARALAPCFQTGGRLQHQWYAGVSLASAGHGAIRVPERRVRGKPVSSVIAPAVRGWVEATERGGPPPLVGLSPGLCGPGWVVCRLIDGERKSGSRILRRESNSGSGADLKSELQISVRLHYKSTPRFESTNQKRFLPIAQLPPVVLVRRLQGTGPRTDPS
jgi:hypothetical protein